MKELEQIILKLIQEYESPKKISFSKKYTFFKKPLIFLRQKIRNITNFLNFKIHFTRKKIFFNHIVAQHQSVLRRKLGNSEPRLQECKITNIKQAIKQLNGIIISPNSIFSFWNIVGKPTYKKGYVDGMLLSNGKVVEGIGGGLCQLSNFIYWIFLHTPTKTIERYHHSLDVFPDSGRVLPFGSGATILYNFIDLKIKNTSKNPLQLKIWLADKYLKGQILSTNTTPKKIHIFEKNHFLIKKDKQYFRYNEIYQEIKIDGKITEVNKIATNFAPILYKIDEEYLHKNNFKVLDFSPKK